MTFSIFFIRILVLELGVYKSTRKKPTCKQSAQPSPPFYLPLPTSPYCLFTPGASTRLVASLPYLPSLEMKKKVNVS